MIWPADYAQTHRPIRKKYLSNVLIHQDEWPRLPAAFSGGIIIDLSNTDVHRQLAGLISTDALGSDHELVSSLADSITAIKQRHGIIKAADRLNGFDLLSCPLIDSLDPEAQERIR